MTAVGVLASNSKKSWEYPQQARNVIRKRRSRIHNFEPRSFLKHTTWKLPGYFTSLPRTIRNSWDLFQWTTQAAALQTEFLLCIGCSTRLLIIPFDRLRICCRGSPHTRFSGCSSWAVIGLERDRINSTQASRNPEFAVFTALQRDTSRMRR
jgi:hypothetical protein